MALDEVTQRLALPDSQYAPHIPAALDVRKNPNGAIYLTEAQYQDALRLKSEELEREAVLLACCTVFKKPPKVVEKPIFPLIPEPVQQTWKEANKKLIIALLLTIALVYRIYLKRKTARINQPKSMPPKIVRPKPLRR